MHKTIAAVPPHTRHAFDMKHLPKLVRRVRQVIKEVRPDAILVCGHSGLIVGSTVSYLTRTPIIAVRKASEEPVAYSQKTQRANAVLHDGPAKRWLWLDDLIASGGTFRHSVREAHKAGLIESVIPAGIMLYNVSEASARDYRLASMDLGLDLLDRSISNREDYYTTTIPTFGYDY